MQENNSNSIQNVEQARDGLASIIEEFYYIGEWVNEIEQLSLFVYKNRTCVVSYIDKEGQQLIKIKGKWELKDNKMLVLWEDEWNYGKNKRAVYEYKKKEEKERLWYLYSDLDKKKLGVEGQFVFVRE